MVKGAEMKISLNSKGSSPAKMTAAALWLVSLSATGSLALLATLASPSHAEGSFADPSFQATWARTDSLVASGEVKRSWLWGPQSNSGALYEDYAQGVNGKRLVQYFDKSRMEINNPNGSKSDPFFVTNGLLTVELITGYMQTGNNSRVLRWPARIPLAGDTNVETGPTYASFRGAITRNDEKKSGQIVNAEVLDDGSLDFTHGGPGYANFDKYNVHYSYYENATGHNIPDIFWSFLNATGPVLANGKPVTARLSNPYFYATGYPIADAYWAFSTVAGQSTSVLIQPFQRRVLTYVPSAPEGFKVQMGNIGQHYYDWRYKDAGKPPELTGSCESSPVLGFGKVYSDNLPIKLALGCMQASEFRATVTRQAFEHGSMLGVVRLNSYSNQYYEEVHAVFDDNTAHSYHFFPLAVGAGTPPPSGAIKSYKSTADFANVWSQNADVKAKLGNPTGDAGTALAAANGTGGAPVQLFTGGLMLYPDPAGKQIYVLFNASGNGYINQGPHLQFADVNNWAVYQDTYQP
jgi:hypothetical protein